MVELRLVLVFAFVYSAAAMGPYFSVVGPNVFRLNHESTVLVSMYEAANQHCSVWLHNGTHKFSERNVTVRDMHPEKVTLKVTEKDIFYDTKMGDKPKYVKLVASCMGILRECEVLVSYKSGYLIAQLDKPLYSPGQKVNYRILALDENLRRNKDAQLAIDIIDASNRTVRRTKPEQKDGVIYKYGYTIPEYADLGLWTLRAFYLGNYSTEARVTFSVEKYVLPTFGVQVKISDRFISPDTHNFTVDVEASYVYGKPVDGKVGLQLYLRNDADGYREYITDTDHKLLNTGKRTFTLVTKDFLKVLPVDVLPIDVAVGAIPPLGYSLGVRATVFEYVTSHEEEGSDDVIFTKDPYKFSFKKSIDSYSPDFLYKLQVEVMYANGELVTNGDVDLTMEDKTLGIKKNNIVAISKGRASKVFETRDVRSDLEFTATFKGVTSQVFTVKPYSGSNKLRMELIEVKKDIELRINSNVGETNQYSKLTVMIIVRGNIEWFKQKELRRSMTETIDDKLLSLIAPSARAVAYYVITSTGEIVASSIRLDIPPKCRGKGLSLRGKKGARIEPGSISDLFIDGEPLMHVGLNAMDSALLLLNTDNIIKTNTMFRLLDKHDLGCGPGGGSNSEEVFKRAGVTVLTNANVNNVKRASMSCDGKSRRKRSAASMCITYNVNETCCDQGASYAQTLISEKKMLEKVKPDLRVDIISKCYARKTELLKNDNYTALCINAYLKSCLELLYEDQEKDTDVSGRSDDDESDYERDIRKWNDGKGISKVRSNFKESWLFEDVQLSKKGAATKTMLIPDSITTWHIQGIGYSETGGVCISEPLDIVSFRKFFIQLDLPYSAVRLENVNVKMSVFNYHNGPLEVHAYIEGQKDVCSMARLGEHSPQQTATVLANNATSFDFLVLPMVADKHDIVVTAFGKPSNTGATQTDAVQKTLLVENEGKPVSKTINVCLDPVDEMKDCENSEEVYGVASVKGTMTIRLNLRVPKEALPKTGHAVGYVKSNLMTDVSESALQGMDSFIRMPTGCAQQTTSKLVLLVYAMSYLKQTKQMTTDVEKRGNDYIRRALNPFVALHSDNIGFNAGVDRVQPFRLDNYAYSLWGTGQGSTWLTAFLMKVFCQAKKTVDNSVNADLEIVPTLEYLLTQQNNGVFTDPRPVFYQLMGGQPSLTAFVVTSFMECDARTKEMNATMLKSVRYLEEDVPFSDYKNNPFLLAITTYALGMAKSSKRWDFMDILEGIAKKDANEKKIHWGNAGQYQNSANDIETTAYALLAYLTFNKLEESASIVRWLSQQRHSGGYFRSTQDTVVALQALSEYTVRTYKKDVNLKVHFITPIDRKLNVTTENAKVMKVVEDLHSGDGVSNVTIKVEGEGSARLSIELTYNMPGKNDTCPFNVNHIEIEGIISGTDDIDEEIAKERNCDVCGLCDDDEEEEEEEEQQQPQGQGSTNRYCVRFEVRSEDESDMAIVRFGLQTGVNVIVDDLKKLMSVENTTIARYETPAPGQSYVVFYLDKLGPEPMNFIFRVTDDFTGYANTRQMARVEVYEYYNPDRTCTKFYGVDSHPGKPVPYECSGPSNTNCQCLQHICAKNYVDIFMNKKRTKLKGKPANKLIRHICTTRKATFAVIVKIISITNDTDHQLVKATGEVKKVIHKGKEDLKKTDKMTFRFRSFCKQPDLKNNTQFYILGKDGIPIGPNSYEYELMADAVVLQKHWKNPKKPWLYPKKLMTALSYFEKLMIKRGCQS